MSYKLFNYINLKPKIFNKLNITISISYGLNPYDINYFNLNI